MGTKGSTVLEPLGRGLFPPADPRTVSGSATCALPPRYDAVKSARDFTGETLGRWRLESEFDTVSLVVSELVTNALRHGLAGQRRRHGAGADTSSAPGCVSDFGAGATSELQSPVRLDLMRWAARLVCAVRDPSGDPPVVVAADAGRPPAAVAGDTAPATPGSGAAAPGSDADEELLGLADVWGLAGHAAESGRGLHLVESFSDGWGWHPLTGAVRGKVVWALFRTGPGPGPAGSAH